MAQGVKVVALDDQVAPRPGPAGQLGHKIECDEIVIQRRVALDFVRLPDKAKSRRVATVARFQQAKQVFPVKMVVT
jgi:hypothetical protein